MLQVYAVRCEKLRAGDLKLGKSEGGPPPNEPADRHRLIPLRFVFGPGSGRVGLTPV